MATVAIGAVTEVTEAAGATITATIRGIGSSSAASEVKTKRLHGARTMRLLGTTRRTSSSPTRDATTDRETTTNTTVVTTGPEAAISTTKEVVRVVSRLPNQEVVAEAVAITTTVAATIAGLKPASSPNARMISL